jgi:hypothetical protein
LDGVPAAPQRFCDVPREHLAALWPHVLPHVVRVLEREGSGRFLPEDILALLFDAKARLWVSWNPDERAIEAAVITETVDYPRARALRIWLVAGRNMRAWVREAEAMIEAFARAQGCAFIEGAMRRGWLRVGHGYKETGLTFEKRL